MQAPQSIVVLDFGSQYTQLIARRIREFNVFSVVLPCTAKLEEVMSYSPVGIILSGGPSSVYDADAPAMDERVLAVAAKPVLGVCYGLQVMTYKLGGKVRPASKREYGHAQVHVAEDSKLFKELPPDISVWMSHGDEAEQLPAGFKEVARSSNALAAMENAERRMWAVQFHPEVHHTPMGKQILKNFVFDICGALPNWTPAQFILETVENIRKQVGEQGRAICALSGGVDSSVAATLVDRAMGNRLTCVFVNNGVLRKNEFAKVQQTLRDKLGLNLRAVDATDRFLSKLKGVVEPEKKRKIIGKEFIEVFDDEAHTIERRTRFGGLVGARHALSGRHRIDIGARAIADHQVAPQRRRSSRKDEVKADRPLKDLFKDEVRRIGRDLGMPEEILQRQPLPRSRTGSAHPWRSYAGTHFDSAGSGRHRGYRDQESGTVQPDLAVVRRAAASDVGGRDGRSANVCLHLRHPRGAFGRWHDRRLGAAAARGAEDDFAIAWSTRCAGSIAWCTT